LAPARSLASYEVSKKGMATAGTPLRDHCAAILNMASDICKMTSSAHPDIVDEAEEQQKRLLNCHAAVRHSSE
jgi:D-alanyl-D-alanine dipeptidase